jgi:hypothetical protein
MRSLRRRGDLPAPVIKTLATRRPFGAATGARLLYANRGSLTETPARATEWKPELDAAEFTVRPEWELQDALRVRGRSRIEREGVGQLRPRIRAPTKLEAQA